MAPRAAAPACWRGPGRPLPPSLLADPVVHSNTALACRRPVRGADRPLVGRRGGRLRWRPQGGRFVAQGRRWLVRELAHERPLGGGLSLECARTEHRLEPRALTVGGRRRQRPPRAAVSF